MKRNIKYKVLSIVILLIVSLILNAQHGNINNFDSIYQIQLDYLEELANEQSKELYELTEYKRLVEWATHFATKLDENGGMKKFGEATYDYYNANNDVESDIDFSWDYNSPEGLWKGWDGILKGGSGQGLIISLWIDEDSLNHIMAGGQYCGGLWETENGGNVWKNISENEPMIQGISSIFVDPDDANIIYITTAYEAEGPRGYANGLYYTEDGGDNWHINECNTYDPFETPPTTIDYYPYGHPTKGPRKFLQNQTNDSIMYLLTPYRLLISKNKGENWTVLINKEKNNPGIYHVWSAKQYFDDMVFDPVNDSTIYITGPEAFRIDSNGQSITNITDSLLPDPSEIVAAAIQVDAHINYPDSIWFSLIDTTTKKTHVILFNKATNTYVRKNTGLNISTSWFVCEVSPKNANLIALGGGSPVYCYNFSDNMKGYMNKVGGFHNDMRSAVWPDTKDSQDFILFGTDGGATKVFDFMANGSSGFDFDYIANDSTDGIRNLDVQGFNVSRNGEDVIAIGTSHNGLIIGCDSGWIKPFSGGDVQSILIDPFNPNNIYVVHYGHAEIEYSNNLGVNHDTLFSNYPYSMENPPILFYKPNDSKTIYAGSNGVIWEFAADNIPLDTPDSVTSYYLPFDTNKFRYIKEVGINDDLENMFFAATNRYWMSWKGWSCQSGGLPHNIAMFRVEIVDTGMVFNDISENLDNGLCGGPITGITIELNGADTIVYASFGNTSSHSEEQKNKKVYYSKDLGESWYAMADSLPENIPVNDIQYHKESGMLYLVNDVGVYYFDRSDSIWMNITDDLPPMSYSQIRFSHKRGKILVSSHAKGVWEADLPCFSDSIDINIRSNTTWNYSVPVWGDIIIDSGAVLTVKKEVYMPACSRVIVERGGKLIVDGGKFTHACGEMWYGIELRGTTDSLQNPAYQGTVEIENGGIIENSQEGIYTGMVKYCDGPWVSGYTGGIIRCDSAYFINNKLAAQLFGYSHSSASSFVNTTFETNDDYIGTSDPDFFVKVMDMTGVDFGYCRFLNNSSIEHFHSGVNCYSSGVNFLGNCSGTSTCDSADYGLFKNLNYGITAYFTTTTSKYLDVRNIRFSGNFRGLQISGSDGCRVTSNIFDIGTDFTENGGCGMYLDVCTGYWVEDNTFKHSFTSTPTGIGLVVQNSGYSANEIYRNYFENLDQGVSAQERNKSRTQGLQILCNEFDDCTGDILVPTPSTTKRGIAPNQGVANSTDPEDMAGNEFYYETTSTDYDDINNEGDGIDYFYDDFSSYNVEPKDYYGVDPEDITTIPAWNPENGCPSQISSGGGGLKSTALTYREQLEYYSGMIESTEATLEALIDGGDTEALNIEVELSTPPETMNIYTDLLNESPYLSETVVESAIDKENVLPNAMVRDVMVANPQSANSDQLIEKLDERNTPMPDYMKAQILQGKSIVSLKQELESQLANLKLKQSRAINGLIREYNENAINQVSASDSIMALYESINDMNIKYRLAMLNLQSGEYAEGTTVMDAILTDYNLSTDEIAEHNHFVDYYNIVKGIKQNGRTELEASAGEIQEIMSIMQESRGIAGVYARNVLLALDEIEYLAPIQLPNLLKSTKEMENLVEILNAEPPKHLEVFPNPSRDYVIIHYNLEMEKPSKIEIKDVNGIQMTDVIINLKENQVTVNTQNWKPGVYIATLKIDGQSLESCKFTLVK